MTTTLTRTQTREISDEEIFGLIDGTGVLAWFWWKGVKYVRNEDGSLKEIIVKHEHFADETKVGATTITPQKLVDSVAKGLEKGLLDASSGDVKDMLDEDLGYADALAADVVLQLAVFDDVVYG